jgi:hypothetical protein
MRVGPVDDSDAADSEALDGGLDEFELTDFSDARRRGPSLPPIETLSNIPATQPRSQQDRNYVAQQVARNARLATEYLSEVATSASHWLNEKCWEIRSFQDAPKSLGELHDGVFQADKRGYDVHEAARAAPWTRLPPHRRSRRRRSALARCLGRR